MAECLPGLCKGLGLIPSTTQNTETEWYTTVVPDMWEASAGELLTSVVQDQSGQHSETLSQINKSFKISLADWSSQISCCCLWLGFCVVWELRMVFTFYF